MLALAAWMVFSKFIKLITHFVRYPVDLLLWPISVVFGWFHGGIKYYALATLSEVCLVVTIISNLANPLQTTWGSRAGADASDSERMIKQSKSQGQYEMAHEKTFHEKLPLGYDLKSYKAYDLKRNQALAA